MSTCIQEIFVFGIHIFSRYKSLIQGSQTHRWYNRCWHFRPLVEAHFRWSFVISYLKSKSKNRITGVFFLLFVVYVKKMFYHSSTLVFKSLDLPKIHPLSPWHWLWLQLRCLCLDVNWLQWAPEKFGEMFERENPPLNEGLSCRYLCYIYNAVFTTLFILISTSPWESSLRF